MIKIAKKLRRRLQRPHLSVPLSPHSRLLVSSNGPPGTRVHLLTFPLTRENAPYLSLSHFPVFVVVSVYLNLQPSHLPSSSFSFSLFRACICQSDCGRRRLGHAKGRRPNADVMDASADAEGQSHLTLRLHLVSECSLTHSPKTVS